MQLKAFGKKYPFLQGNLAFWERYIKARDELFKLLSHAPCLKQLKHSDFLQNMERGIPLLAYHDIRFSEDEINTLAESFCRNMGLIPRSVVFPDRVPVFEALMVSEDEDGFVLAEIHAAIASYAEHLIAGEEEAINWLEHFCPVCGANAGMGLIAPSGKKNLVCSHCHSLWVFLRTACGLCGNFEERGTTILSAEELPNWFLEVCSACGHNLKICDMREELPDIIVYPLHYLTTWEFDLSAKEHGYELVMFKIFERAGWLQPLHTN